MSKHPLSAEAFHEILHRGRLDEIIAAARAGTEMHPELPDHLVRDHGCMPVLSPLGMAWRWDWAKRPEKCLEAVRALIEAGADPDAPDEGDYQPLHALLFTWKTDLPVEATKVLLQAGADPSMSTATPDQVRPLAMGVCIAHVLPHHARTLLEHDPQQAILCAGSYTVLECLARVGDRWTEDVGRLMVRQLLEHGVNPADSNLDAIKESPVREWVRWAQAAIAQDGLSTTLPVDPSQPSRLPRL